jgi:hypothetical protein
LRLVTNSPISKFWRLAIVMDSTLDQVAEKCGKELKAYRMNTSLLN